jgi:hypothetical protein
MQESTIEQEMYHEEKILNTEGIQEQNEVEQSQGIGIDLSILKSQTGEGSVSDYLEHPLNFNKSNGLARILRGLTGIMGNLNLAIIDIVVGTLEFFKERKGSASV